MSDKMVTITLSSPYVGTDIEYETDISVDEWNEMDDKKKDELVNGFILEYVSVSISDDDGNRVDW